eukprot:TRINITY_DN16593_c0_g1_i1.p1 TRINITY_DN16593_c0_g1~~TRINITY_DN16593_c0_g1_i1.p1  ORF type:complete len:215 (+),score=57.61 TRINITY_DN16593_c0_g1_i1:55-645(+)
MRGASRPRSSGSPEVPAKVRRIGDAPQQRGEEAAALLAVGVTAAAACAAGEYEQVVATGSRATSVRFPRGQFAEVAYLDESAHGEVWSAVASASARRVVIKKQCTRQLFNAEVAHRELHTLVHITLAAPHPSIVEILGCWLVGDVLCIVEERLGMSLMTWIASRWEQGCRYETTVSLWYSVETCAPPRFVRSAGGL